MKQFHTLAVPHQDILAGRLTMDIFAADLWEVYHKRGPHEYSDPETFFAQTYLTDGLKNLLEVIAKRLQGLGGDSTIQIQTPFGGGKTHALIALLHKSIDWKAKTAVIVGTNLSANDTLWGTIEEQLTGGNKSLTGLTSPGKDKLKNMLASHQPLLILIDELLEYVTKAAGVKVEQTTLAAQTMAFIQELTETAAILERVCVVVTLPSSLMEHYDEAASRLYSQLQKVVGRVEKIYTPVAESEIAKIIRRRLFSSVDEAEVKKTVKEIIEYAQREGILPPGLQPTEYRDRFIDSYPFTPEVIDVLYHRWGSFPTFQRTRGVLRLLSLVIATTRDQNIPYITLADFDLNQQEIRQELLKHLGAEYNSVIAQDITDVDCGSKKVDMNLGNSYRGLKLASRAATTIFMYSFSGGSEKGATLAEIKRSATTLNNPSSVVAEAVEQLKTRLFYFQVQSDKYFFSNQPNLNRILLTKMENIKDEAVLLLEKDLLKQSTQGDFFNNFIWEENHAAIPDTETLKLVILDSEKKDVIASILKNKGTSMRVNCNTIFFLFPNEMERMNFINQLKRYLAYTMIAKDNTLALSEEQQKEIKNEIKREELELKEALRRYYRFIGIPTKEGYKKEDLGTPTYGDTRPIDQKVYERLRSNSEILEKIVPLFLKERYLKNKDYVSTLQILNSCYRTPSEPRIKDRSVLEEAIKEGTKNGIFGLGEILDHKPICRYYKEIAPVGFTENEILIHDKLCQKISQENQAMTNIIPPANINLETEKKELKDLMESSPALTNMEFDSLTKLKLEFKIPLGKISDILRIISFLQTKFKSINIFLDASDGQISKQEFEIKVKEAFCQLGVEIINKG